MYFDNIGFQMDIKHHLKLGSVNRIHECPQKEHGHANTEKCDAVQRSGVVQRAGCNGFSSLKRPCYIGHLSL